VSAIARRLKACAWQDASIKVAKVQQAALGAGRAHSCGFVS
jgi:hypothetical protein